MTSEPTFDEVMDAFDREIIRNENGARDVLVEAGILVPTSEPTTAAEQHIRDLKLLYQGVALIIGKPEEVVGRIVAEARAAAERDVAALREAVESELARLVGLADRYAGPGPGSVGSLVDLQNVYGSFEVLRRLLTDTVPAASEADDSHSPIAFGLTALLAEEAAEPRWPSGSDAERELAAALHKVGQGLEGSHGAELVLAALQEKRDPGE